MSRVTVNVSYYRDSGQGPVLPPVFAPNEPVTIVAEFSEPVGRPQFGCWSEMLSQTHVTVYIPFPMPSGSSGYSKTWIATHPITETVTEVRENARVRRIDIMPYYISVEVPAGVPKGEVLQLCNASYPVLKGDFYQVGPPLGPSHTPLPPDGFLCPSQYPPCLFIKDIKFGEAGKAVFPPFRNGQTLDITVEFNELLPDGVRPQCTITNLYGGSSGDMSQVGNTTTWSCGTQTVHSVIGEGMDIQVACDYFLRVRVDPYEVSIADQGNVAPVQFRSEDGGFYDIFWAPTHNLPTAKVEYTPSGPYRPGQTVGITVTFEKEPPKAPNIAVSSAVKVPVFIQMEKDTSMVYKCTYVAGSSGRMEVKLSSKSGEYSCNPPMSGFLGALFTITEGRTFNVDAQPPHPHPHPGPLPHLNHVSCKKCPVPGYGSVVHPQTRVPYLQSTNQPGNLLTRGMIISRDVRVAVGRRGGSKLQFGNCRQTNCQKKPPSTSIASGDCNVAINQMGAWSGAPGGSRTPPRNSF